MRLESRIVKLERLKPAESGHPFDRLTPEQLASIAREFLLAEVVENEFDSTAELVQRAMESSRIEPDGLAEWLRAYA